MPNDTTFYTYTVSDMNCAHCEQKVSAALSSVPGVAGVKPNASTKKVEITVDPANLVPFETMADAVKKAGYTLSR